MIIASRSPCVCRAQELAIRVHRVRLFCRGSPRFRRSDVLCRVALAGTQTKAPRNTCRPLWAMWYWYCKRQLLR